MRFCLQAKILYVIFQAWPYLPGLMGQGWLPYTLWSLMGSYSKKTQSLWLIMPWSTTILLAQLPPLEATLWGLPVEAVPIYLCWDLSMGRKECLEEGHVSALWLSNQYFSTPSHSSGPPLSTYQIPRMKEHFTQDSFGNEITVPTLHGMVSVGKNRTLDMGMYSFWFLAYTVAVSK